MAVTLGFWSKCLQLFLIYKSPWYFLLSFKSIGLLVQENFKTDFQDGGHLGFPIWTIFASFDTSYQVSNLLSFQKKFKIYFENGSCGGHLGFPIRMILATCHLQDILKHTTKFQVSWSFGSAEVQNRCSRWWTKWPSRISDRNDF